MALDLGHRLSQGITEHILPQHHNDTGIVEHHAHLRVQMHNEQGDATILQTYTSDTMLRRRSSTYLASLEQFMEDLHCPRHAGQ